MTTPSKVAASGGHAPDAAVERPAPHWPRWAFSITSTIAAVMLFDQAIFAGQFLGGADGAFATHRDNANYAGIAVAVSTIAAVLVRWPGRGPWWPLVGCVGLVGLTGLVIHLGYAGETSAHVPLGVAIMLLGVILPAFAWRPGWAWRRR